MVRRTGYEIDSKSIRCLVDCEPLQGVPVVFVHGLGGAASDFEEAFEAAPLDGRCRIAPDLPGFGESDKPEDFSYDLAAQAELLEKLLATMGCRTVDVVGHSMGGVVAILLARLHPERIGRLLVAEPNLVPRNARISRSICDFGSEAAFRKGYAAFLGQYDRPERPAAYRFFKTLTQTTPSALFRSATSLLGFADGGLYRDFLAFGMPRGYLMGARSWQVVQEEMMSDFRAAGIACRVIPDAGHGMMGDNPTAFYGAVAAILAG
jgi:pimeloyl-ACP methyl ester carboxylesterase